MANVTISAATDESAVALEAALAPFAPQLIEDADGQWRVAVHVVNGSKLGVVLNAVARHFREQGGAPHVEVDGIRYLLDPHPRNDA